MPLVTLAIDPGTSLTKCIYQVDGNSPQLLALPPEAVELPGDFEHTVENQCQSVDIYGSAAAEDILWYRLKKDGNIFVVGSLAQKYQQGVDIKRLKYESAEIKIVGIVGAIARREQFEEFDLDIAMLLPYGEYKDGEKLKQKVKRALSQHGFFWHGKERIKAHLGQWLCYPEGSGRMFRYLEEVGREQFSQQNIAVLMLGHRNGSILKLKGGRSCEDSESSDKYGFYRFLDYVLEEKSGYDPENFLDSIVVNQHDRLPTEYTIDARQVAEIRNRNADNIERETAEIETAIQSAKLRYVRSLETWIEEKTRSFPLDNVLFCGGACPFFRDVLEEFGVSEFELDVAGVGKPTIDPYHDELVDELSDELNLATQDRGGLGYRFIDVYSLFRTFKPKHDQLQAHTPETEAVHA